LFSSLTCANMQAAARRHGGRSAHRMSAVEEGQMYPFGKALLSAGLVADAALVAGAQPADAKDKVKVGFIGPLTGGVSANGLGGRNSADLAVKLRNADAKAKYSYEIVVFDDECKPNVAVQVATKMAADKDIIAGATHYC
jgi:branched-chain amino acid transport system substrate-binding protein